MGAFLHAVGVFFHHLQEVKWAPLGLALACHVTRLLFRARAWQNIVRAAYPDTRLKYRSAFGAYVAGVGVNSVAPARGGDLVKLYLVKHRTEESTYPTLASTLVVETLFDFVVAGALMVWALSIGVLPTHQVYSRIPTVDWKFFLRHEHATALGLIVVFFAAVIGQAWVSPALEVAFFAVAGGSILYVVVQLFEVCRRFAMPTLVAWSLLLGLLLGFGTDWVLVAAGA